MPLLQDTANLLYRLAEISRVVPSSEGAILYDLKTWRKDVREVVEEQGCDDKLLERKGAFWAALINIKNDIVALLTFKSPQLLHDYFKYCWISASAFVDKILNSETGNYYNVTPFGNINVDRQRAMANEVRDRVLTQQNLHYQSHNVSHPVPSVRDPTHVHPPQHPGPPAVHNSHHPPEPHRTDHLNNALQAVFAACGTRGISNDTQHGWKHAVQQAIGRFDAYPEAEQKLLCGAVRAGSSAVLRAQDLHDAENALSATLTAIESLVHQLHATLLARLTQLNALGHSSRPMHRLSHRQQLIYPRAFMGRSW